MTTEKMEFKAEVQQLLNLMVHSLYSHKEIFLREVISNASDAIDRARYESLTDKDIIEGKGRWKIKIIPDEKAGTLTIRDNGVGMTKEEVIQSLGTIAHSGTQEFIKALQSKEVQDNPELIGQFGVGFYSSFMVADKVTVLTKKAGQKDSPGVKWESTADGSYTIEEFEKEGGGTDVVLHLKEDEKKYLQQWQIRQVVKKYSDYIEHPVTMDVEQTKESELKKGEKYTSVEEETLNSMKAIWLRSVSDVTEEEYNEFYKHVSHDFTDPLKVIHYRAEGTSEFTSLLYIPSHRPFDIFNKDFKIGPTLYVKRVQILDHCEEVIPLYLRFVKGVVDSSDLPLNVSREILQSNRQIETIRKSITKKILDALRDMKADDYDSYLGFFKEFGKVLKEGIHYDIERKEAIADLMLLESSKKDVGAFTTFQEYVDNMKEGQEEIYFLTGASREEVAISPHLEAFGEKGYEVLFMLDEVDDIIMNDLGEFKGKKITSVVKGEIDLDKHTKEEKEEAREKFGKLLDLIKEALKDDLKDVRLSGRLKDSVCCLVGDEGQIDPQMEKMLRSMGQAVPVTKRILEINSDHPLFQTMKEVFEKNPANPLLEEYAKLLYDQALLLEGSKPKDPAFFAKTMTRLMTDNAGKDLEE